ncbi:hypothetical protein O7608_09280 [Solwaraspora sp. WMMA2056]|uniref:hypothetical protein n=1 Tax=Solwaraspora sp. WMMA2056 TaxID=3015161 RepID=UPI00259BDE3A|nr:hypothetical protein [Solwaraspora sp. WMMA2056]WJK42545.1 hypothetical protein O7608_09280 [Solwaraspora sp. WMMA2056]
MTSQSVPAVAADPVPADAAAGPVPADVAPVPRPGNSVVTAVTLAGLTLAWLALLIWSVLATLAASTDGVLAVTETAYGLPAVIFAALLAGAGVAQAVRRATARRLDATVLPRLLVAVAAGALTGAVAAAALVFGDGRGGSAVTILGWALFAGATVGGTLAGLHRWAGLLTAAGAAAGLAVAVAITARELFKGPLLELFGAGQTAASVLAAQSRIVWVSALLAGAIAGAVAFGWLAGASRRSTTRLPWPTYLVAGAAPGVLLLVAELITRVGGAELLGLARSFSETDEAFQAMADAGRINSALVVLFAGSFTALICLGRTLPSRPDQADDPADPAVPAGPVRAG